MRKKSKTDLRINAAIVGFRIPILEIPALYRSLEQAITAGWDDAHLRKIVATHEGVEVAS